MHQEHALQQKNTMYFPSTPWLLYIRKIALIFQSYTRSRKSSKRRRKSNFQLPLNRRKAEHFCLYICKRIMVEWFLHFKNRLCALLIVSRPITFRIRSLFYFFMSIQCFCATQINKRLQCPIHVITAHGNLWKIWGFHIQITIISCVHI